MKFTKAQLENIIMFGTVGKTFSEVALFLGFRPDELRDMRLKDSKLDDALERFQYNYDLFRIDQFEKTAGNVKSKIAVDYFKLLKDLRDKRTDNEIIIREVE